MELIKHSWVCIFIVFGFTAFANVAEEAENNSPKPFEAGDIFVAATVMDNPDDDHAGTGRILQYDQDLNLKGALWPKGTSHKIGGLTFDSDGVLWGFAQLTPVVLQFSPDGKQLPIHKWSDRSFSNVTFGPDGSFYFGEHLAGKSISAGPNISTTFRFLPGREVVGDGWIFKYSQDRKQVDRYETDFHPMPPFLAITSTVLTDNGKRMIYISENGNRVMQFDLLNKKQLPDLALLQPDWGIPMVLVMVAAPDGRLLISTNLGFMVLDPDTGELLDKRSLGGMGWAALAPGINNEHIVIGNFFTGEIVKYRFADGEITARNNIGQKNSLSGVAQFPGIKNTALPVFENQ
ncbi:MAG: hypothetical protein VYA80_02935 [Pseudomonadota bacterium]|nr:hypothetical protein [Pseudomonadota bacterium]